MDLGRMSGLAVVLAALLSCAAACSDVSAPPKGPSDAAHGRPASAELPEGLRFGTDVRGEELEPATAEREWVAPTALRAEPPTAWVDGGRVVAAVVLVNPEPTPFRLIVNPYGGDFPYGGQSPFLVRFASPLVRYEGKLFPPEPPLPMRIVLPPNSRVVFTEQIDLENWAWDGSPEVELAWGLHYFRRPSPEGVLKVRLP